MSRVAATPEATPEATPADTAPLLCVRQLCKTFGGVHAVDGIDFDVARGELLALIGRASCRERV